MRSWSLCIATLNRHDVLMAALRHTLRQTVLPAQIVVVDASEGWEESRAGAETLLANHEEITLTYVEAPERSSATQRNHGIKLCTGDIIFMLDDDSFMHPTCAEEVLRVYDADTDGALAGVAAHLVDTVPAEAGVEQLEQKVSLRPGLKSRILSTGVGRFVARKILFQSMDELFLRYDEPRARALPAPVAALDAIPCAFMPGCAISVRREVALRESFDTSLRFYAAFEDLDVTYRYARHGLLAQAKRAHLHHFEAAAGRIKRKKVMIFQLLNMVVFLKRHAPDPEGYKSQFRVLIWRRLLGEIIKDALSRRFDFPQARGVWQARGLWREVWDKPLDEIDAWYPGFQRKVLDEIA